MFGRTKAGRVQEPKTFAWKTKDLEAFAQKLAGAHPLIATNITGIRHSMRVDGQSYRSAIACARAEQTAYESMPMIFDDRPASPDLCRLVASEYDVSGVMSWPPAIVQGSMSACVEASQISDSGVIGHLSITSNDTSDESSARPLLTFHFDFLDLTELTEATNSLKVTLAGRGTAWMNFLVVPIKDAQEWISSFTREGYSPSLHIVKAYLSAESGRMFGE